MPVDTTHREHDAHVEKWQRCRDVVAGGDDVKERGTAYLPKLGGQNDGEYGAYRARALFFGAAGRTVQGLEGALFRKDPDVDVPESHEELLESVTMDGLDATEFSRRAAREVLTTGRLGILVDMPSDAEGAPPYLAPYAAEKIINWRTATVGADSVLTRVVLEETVWVEDPADEWALKDEKRWRALEIEDGWYVVRLYKRGQESTGFVQVGEDVVPRRAGARLDRIPFYFVNANNLSVQIGKPPLLDLVDVNLSHYRTSADLEHGAHFTALPTAWVAGFPADSTLRIGSSTAWVTTETNAKAGFLEYTGQGLSALVDLKDSKEAQMAVLGARMLEPQKRAVEAAETHEIRQAGEHSALAAIGRSVGLGIERALRKAVWWAGGSDADVEKTAFSLNDDFVAAHMDPRELESLMKAWQGGGMSLDTFLWNLKRGEVLPPDRTVDDEKELIEAEGGRDPGPAAGTVTPIGRRFSVENDANGNPIGIREEVS